MGKIFAIFKLKLLQLRTNWAMLTMMTLSPILFTLVIGNMSAGELDLVNLYIADEDQTAISREIVQSFEPTVYLVEQVDAETIFAKVKNNEAEIGYIIPAGFGDKLLQGEVAEVQVVKQPDTQALDEIPTLMNSTALRIRSARETAALVTSSVERYQGVLEPAVKEQMHSQVVVLVNQSWENPQVSTSFIPITAESSYAYDQKAQSSMGFLIFFLMFTLTFGINEILDEKRNGTWTRILSTPTRSWQILGGHFIGTMLIGAVQVVLLIGFGRYVMGVQWGRSPLGVFLLLFALIFALTALGLMLAGFVRNRRQLQALYPVLIVSTSMLGGCMWPLEIVPPFMRTVAYFIPQGQAMMGLTDLIVRGADVTHALLPILALLAMGVVFFAVGAVNVQRDS